MAVIEDRFLKIENIFKLLHCSGESIAWYKDVWVLKLNYFLQIHILNIFLRFF